jgi:transcriptional regulator with XRE-family HTH domain
MDPVQPKLVRCSEFEQSGGTVADDVPTPEDALARELARWRKVRDLTAQQLADRIAERGGNLSRQAISKIENGDRKVTLDEVATLAIALNVSPVLLAFPLGREDVVRILDQDVPTWNAVRWWSGRDTDEDSAAILGYFEDHEVLVNSARIFRSAEAGSRGASDVTASIDRLLDLRKNIRRAGLLPPQLPDDMTDIEKEGVDG